jgi:hypothetical protein
MKERERREREERGECEIKKSRKGRKAPAMRKGVYPQLNVALPGLPHSLAADAPQQDT